MNKSACGLNIPELCLSIVIMALAIMTITGMFIAGIMGMRKGDNMVMATNVAQSTLELYEEELMYNFDLYASGTSYLLEDITYDKMRFKRRLMIEDIIDINPANRMKKIEVSIYWYDKSIEGKTSEKEKEIKFSTYLNNYLDYPAVP